ncbi:MAG: DUF2726 domain-containing protein [Candidatus Wildermuthbacteria bacterium]|nr:DUF2726 domain-containing protein [Candidatus Wildermuthbacteria bacterium]
MNTLDVSGILGSLFGPLFAILIIGLLLMSGIALALWFVKAKKSAGGQAEQSKYEYGRKEFFMSRAEHKCYDALVAAVGDKYYIFPQAHLPSIVENRVKGQSWRGARSHIDRKSVDYVLCDKEYIAPKLAIELDDRSHERPDRKERDEEVERVLQEAGLPLLRLENPGYFNPRELAEKIYQKL